jgi:hypothetical protein
MRRYFTTVFLGLALVRAALAGPASSITPEYYNYGLLTTTPTVDAYSFYNAGDFEIDAIVSATPTNLSSGLFINGFNPQPFATKDTLYFTNTVSGLMSAYPGFLFDTATSTSRFSASWFLNQGIVEGFDVQGFALDALYSPVGSTAIVTAPALAQAIPSEIYVDATNIVNSGAISVGNAGVLSLTGNQVTTAFGSLAAGVAGTVGLTNYVDDLTGLQGQDGGAIFVGGPYFYVTQPDVYDLFWGVTNGIMFNTDDLGDDLPYTIPNIFSGARGTVLLLPEIPANDNAQFSVSGVLYQVGTNVYYNLVFVNTNFSNSNMTATVGFTGAEYLQYASATVPADFNAEEDIVQIAEPVFDVITGQIVTNGIYLIDDGALLPSMSPTLNASVEEQYHRPNAFELTTVTPFEWADAVLFGEEFSFPYFPELIEQGTNFNNNMEALEFSEYGAQIGRNPADNLGSFSSLAETNSEAFELLSDLIVDLPDPTNEPARIQINAGNLDVSQARLRADGMVILNATNLIGGGTSAVDFGEANASLGVTNGSLSISNVFPTTFQRIRGDIYAVSATWQNTQTNPSFIFPGTNQWHYHVLVVDQNMFGSFPSTVRKLTLTGQNSIVLHDNLHVIDQVVINTTNLTVAASNYFNQNAEDFTPLSTPFMKNLFINTNGFLGTGNILDVGFNETQAPAAPVGRSYTVNTITNFGQMSSISPLLQSAIFENDGTVTANTGGSILIAASNLCLGLALTNTTNYLLAAGSVNLSAITIQATNSVISAGLGEPAALVLNATEQMTDLVSGTPTTNTNSVIVNHWTVTDGFTLENKPATGDLFGTEIHSISAQNFQYVTHVWAATDEGPNPAGFMNNAVIGHLLLDRVSSNSVLHFSAAGARNAMYVDYLDLTNYAYTNYRTGLAIDPNFTIYFADCNLDPTKLQQIYTNLIWVTNFVGPNSKQVVPYTNSSIVCLMNGAVANSTVISFWDGLPNYYFLQNYGPYLLNGPFGTNFMTCPGTYTFPCNCTPGANVYQLLSTNVSSGATNLNVLTVSYNGQGSITPVLTASQLTLDFSYTLTAKPATGWVFDSWTVVTPGNAYTYYSNVLTFAFVTNTVVTANFIPVPFPALEGLFDGLFYETNAVDPGSSGAVSLTLSKTGGFSGKLLIGSTSYKFTSQFSGSGAAGFLAKNGAQSLTVNLQLDVTNQEGLITGDVNGGTWDAALTAYLTPAWTAKNPSPLAGSYTMSLPWYTGTDTNDIAGDSYGAGTISKLGVLTLAGVLSDGTAFSASAPVTQNGLWPFYAYSAAGKDYVLGWVTVSNGLSGTNISWNKLAGRGPLYPGGFANDLQLVGSPWQAPPKGSAPLSVAFPAVVLSGGNLPETLTFSVQLKNSLTYAATNVNLSIKSSSGVFTGWFDDPFNGGKKVTISGVVLTDESSARGFFLSTDESGAVLLENQ